MHAALNTDDQLMLCPRGRRFVHPIPPTATPNNHSVLTPKRVASVCQPELQISFPTAHRRNRLAGKTDANNTEHDRGCQFYRKSCPTPVTLTWPRNFMLSPSIPTLSVPPLSLTCLTLSSVIPFRLDQYGPVTQLEAPQT